MLAPRTVWLVQIVPKLLSSTHRPICSMKVSSILLGPIQPWLLLLVARSLLYGDLLVRAGNQKLSTFAVEGDLAVLLASVCSFHIDARLLLITATMAEKFKGVPLIEVENSFITNLFCGEDKLALLEQEGGMFPTHFVQVNLALACNKGGQGKRKEEPHDSEVLRRLPH